MQVRVLVCPACQGKTFYVGIRVSDNTWAARCLGCDAVMTTETVIREEMASGKITQSTEPSEQPVESDSEPLKIDMDELYERLMHARDAVHVLADSREIDIFAAIAAGMTKAVGPPEDGNIGKYTALMTVLCDCLASGIRMMSKYLPAIDHNGEKVVIIDRTFFEGEDNG